MQAGVEFAKTSNAAKRAASQNEGVETIGLPRKTPKKRGSKPVPDENGMYPVSDSIARGLLRIGMKEENEGQVVAALKARNVLRGDEDFLVPSKPTMNKSFDVMTPTRGSTNAEDLGVSGSELKRSIRNALGSSKVRSSSYFK